MHENHPLLACGLFTPLSEAETPTNGARQVLSAAGCVTRFFIDEDLSPTLVTECHRAGYDATCSRNRGKLGVSDRAVAKLCMEEDRILATNNASDFLALAEQTGLHSGLMRSDHSPGAGWSSQAS
jgi:uncharacterized protein DUF5615